MLQSTGSRLLELFPDAGRVGSAVQTQFALSGDAHLPGVGVSWNRPSAFGHCPEIFSQPAGFKRWQAIGGMKSLIFLGCLAVAMAQAQTAATPPVPSPSQQAPANPNAPEMDTRVDTSASFKSHVNLVMVPVVVRDTRGVAVGELTKANFALYDKGRPQEITRFSLEKVGSKALQADAAPADPGGIPNVGEEKATTVVVPERYVAFLFDDVHISVGDLPRVRDAALRHIATLKPSDRAAIFTMSGFPQVDFTDDQARLRDALLRLRPNTMAAVGAMSAEPAATGISTLASLDVVKQVVQRMAGTPGQRIVMLISPGFFTIDPMYSPAKQDILDRAIRANVIISGMDARGLWTDPSFDASQRGLGGGGGSGGAGLGHSDITSRFLAGLSPSARETLRADILAEFASGTGGSVFRNSNDYDEGFRRLATAPEYVYMLGFTPQNLKNDGAFHALRVVVKPSTNVSLEARRGYYAPKKLDDAEATAREEIEAALFSHEDLQELPIDLHTQFFKTNDGGARLAVLLRLDLKLFKFHRADGRNVNTVTMVTGIFDRNGNYLQGIRKVLELHLKDDTLTNRLAQGATIKTNFDLAPGTYLVRQVVRDAEGQQMSATNAAVVIPQ
jgi:VWFA-related protein